VDNGRRIAQGPLGDADQIRYSYNDDGRLAAYANDATGVSATYTYDVHGQRSTAAVSEGAATTAYTFTYEGLTLLRYDAVISTGATETASSVTYLYDGESRPYAGVYASDEAIPVAFGIATTDRGDVRELTDISGTPFAFYAYDAYGTPLAAESTATASVDATLAATIAEANVLRYAGYCFDEHSGMYYLSQRYYDPATCQFITKDPAKADGEEGAYQYCGGDPVGKVDPSGEAWRHSISTTTGVITRLRYATHANLFSREPNAVVSHALEATWYYRIDWYWDPARNVCGRQIEMSPHDCHVRMSPHGQGDDHVDDEGDAQAADDRDGTGRQDHQFGGSPAARTERTPVQAAAKACGHGGAAGRDPQGQGQTVEPQTVRRRA